MDFNLRQLRMLREVAARGTIAAAADSLGYTPSAVSQQLGTLERTAGVEVLERVGRNVRLTDAGRELVRHAEVLLANLEQAQAAMERVGSEPRGTIELSLFESVAATLLPPTLMRLADAHPDISLSTRKLDPDLALDALTLGDLDVAFFLDYPNAPGARPAGIDRCFICRDWFRVVLPEGDPLAAGPVHLADLAERPFIASAPQMSCGRFLIQLCRDAGFDPDIRHQVDDYPVTLRFVAAGAGVALIPDMGLVDQPPGIHITQLAVPVCRTVELAYRSTSADRPGLRALCDTVGEVAADLDLDVSPIAADAA